MILNKQISFKKAFSTLVGLTTISCLSTAMSVAHAGQLDKTKPVLLVHGFMTYDSAQIDCQQTMGKIADELAAQGFTNVKTVTYYKNSTNCDINLNQYDSNNASRDNTWKELGSVLSNYVNENYSRYGQRVDLLGHSMGGLVVRSAVQGGNEGLDGFSNMLVEDAVTIATPHKGTGFASLCIHRQCKSLQPSNPDFAWLATQPKPNSMIITDWSVQASNLDALTSIDSGLDMGVDALHKKVFNGLTHNAQLNNSDSVKHAVTSLGTYLQ